MTKNAKTSKEAGGLLTMADLAAHFSLPESTARYYCKRFDAFLPQEGQGRRKYKPEAIQVFAAVQEAMRRTKHAKSVEMELSLQYPAHMAPAKGEHTAIAEIQTRHPAAVLQEFSQNLLQVLTAQVTALERIAVALDGSLGSRPVPQAPPADFAGSDTGEAISGEIESLRKEIKTLRGLMDSSEEIHQQDVEQLRKWLNRLGSAQENQGNE